MTGFEINGLIIALLLLCIIAFMIYELCVIFDITKTKHTKTGVDIPRKHK